jgi:hypothetical protein
MLHRIKKAAETFDQKRPKIVEQIRSPDKKGGPKPKIRSEMRFASWNYYFNCDICGIEYGPKSSRLPQSDNGVQLWQSHYMFCSNCKRFVCKPRCWNYIQGKCLACAPSQDIIKAQLKPTIRIEHKVTGWKYYFTCDKCDSDFGPEKSINEQVDGGINLTQKYYRQCPECGRFLCRSSCWNYEKGTCTLCNHPSLPEYIVKAEKLRNEYFLICSVCRKQFGPLSEFDWERVRNVALGATKIALGVVSSRPKEAVDGVVDMAEGIKGRPSLRGRLRDVAIDAKTDLAQCVGCNRWVCIDKCWNKEMGVCNNCSGHS